MENVINLNIKGIKCDKCDFRDDEAEFFEYTEYLNEPCPWCGEPLLTQKDLDTIKRLIKYTNFVNRICKWLKIKPKETGKANFRVDMDGSGQVFFKQQ